MSDKLTCKEISPNEEKLLSTDPLITGELFRQLFGRVPLKNPFAPETDAESSQRKVNPRQNNSQRLYSLRRRQFIMRQFVGLHPIHEPQQQQIPATGMNNERDQQTNTVAAAGPSPSESSTNDSS